MCSYNGLTCLALLQPQSLNAAVVDGNLLVQGDVSRDVVRIVGGSVAGQFRVTLNGVEQVLSGVTRDIRIETWAVTM